MNLDAAIAALEAGHIVVFPTETVFGVGCRLDRPDAVERIAEAKGRAKDAPFQVLVATAADMRRIGRIPPDAEPLLERFVPGPLTLVTAARVPLPARVGDGGTVGLRVPDHKVAAALIAECGPIVASSANRSGDPPALTVQDARNALGPAVAVYVDGSVRAGTSSTVVDVTQTTPRILREGAISRAALDEVLEGPIL